MGSCRVVALLLGASGLCGVASAQTLIDAKSNIWGAGPASPPGTNPGIEPVAFSLGFTAAGGEAITFPSISGATHCCSGSPTTTPDGVGNCCNTNLNPANGMSGIQGAGGMFLVGVFHDAAGPTGGAPASLNFNVIGKDFLTLSPAINQVFFIGNGRTGGGVLQAFMSPAGATTLHLGFADGNGFMGAPGHYGDNTGGLTVTVEGLGSCYADCDENGLLDFFDFLCFQNEYGSGALKADCDKSGVLDFFDFLCFQNAFNAGCP